jgi:hypothetical protein
MMMMTLVEAVAVVMGENFRFQTQERLTVKRGNDAAYLWLFKPTTAMKELRLSPSPLLSSATPKKRIFWQGNICQGERCEPNMPVLLLPQPRM